MLQRVYQKLQSFIHISHTYTDFQIVYPDLIHVFISSATYSIFSLNQCLQIRFEMINALIVHDFFHMSSFNEVPFWSGTLQNKPG